MLGSLGAGVVDDDTGMQLIVRGGRTPRARNRPRSPFVGGSSFERLTGALNRTGWPYYVDDTP
jgi:hypothetical protein